MRRQHTVERRIAGDVQADETDDRVDLVERAVRGHAQIVLLAPFAAAERRRPIVAGARIDSIENDHRPFPPLSGPISKFAK